MSHTIELSEEVYAILAKVAEASGTTPAEWIAARLPHPSNGNGKKAEPTEEEIAAANARLEACTVSLGYATGLGNQSIDADLAREYGDDHAALYRGEK